MARQIVHRLLISFPALLGVLFLCFCLLQAVPADPAMIIAGPDAKPDTIAAIRIIPALTLGLVLVGAVARLTRTAVLAVLGADFVRTARGKGLRETVVIVHPALRDALLPVVTLIGLLAAFLLGGAVVTETMF